LVLETREHKETQQIMWNLLDNGIKRVQQCINKLNLNSNAVLNDKKTINHKSKTKSLIDICGLDPFSLCSSHILMFPIFDYASFYVIIDISIFFFFT